MYAGAANSRQQIRQRQRAAVYALNELMAGIEHARFEDFVARMRGKPCESEDGSDSSFAADDTGGS